MVAGRELEEKGRRVKGEGDLRRNETLMENIPDPGPLPPPRHPETARTKHICSKLDKYKDDTKCPPVPQI